MNIYRTVDHKINVRLSEQNTKRKVCFSFYFRAQIHYINVQSTSILMTHVRLQGLIHYIKKGFFQRRKQLFYSLLRDYICMMLKISWDCFLV